MENKATTYKANFYARLSLWTGIVSLLLYGILGIVHYIGMQIVFGELVVAEFILLLLCSVSGIILGSASFITGHIALTQLNILRRINNSERVQKGIRLAITGIVLSILGVILDILVCRDFVTLLYYRD